MRPGFFVEDPESPAPAVAVALAGNSGWHSPVPYLFGGLAAMLGLIAFALLILACSYWKLSSYLGTPADDAPAAADGALTGKVTDATPAKTAASFSEPVAVIMAGDDKPTFLATPICTRASSSVASAGDAAAASTENEERAAECWRTMKRTGAVNHTGGERTPTSNGGDRIPL